MSNEQVSDFLKHVGGLVKGACEARKFYAPRLAPEFNSFVLLAPLETQLSKVIAELLNPKGWHEQGALFWNLFLEEFLSKNAFIPCEVNTEAQTNPAKGNESRRIDILANNKTFALAIENKPWAGDQPEQVKDYLQYLKDRFSSYILIYLSGDGSDPSEESISKKERQKAEDENHFKTLSYKDLIDWLKQCRCQCEAPKVSAFLQEFIDYIRSQFLGIKDMTERTAIVDAATGSPESISAAMEIINAGDDIRAKLCKKLIKDVSDALSQSDLHSQVTLSPDPNNSNPKDKEWWQKKQGFTFFLNSKEDRYGIQFQFEHDGFKEFFFGIQENIGSTQINSEVSKKLSLEFQGSKSSQVWAWWCYLDESLIDWNKNIDAWLQIYKEAAPLAQKIMGQVEKIYNILKKNDLLKCLT